MMLVKSEQRSSKIIDYSWETWMRQEQRVSVAAKWMCRIEGVCSEDLQGQRSLRQ